MGDTRVCCGAKSQMVGDEETGPNLGGATAGNKVRALKAD